MSHSPVLSVSKKHSCVMNSLVVSHGIVAESIYLNLPTEAESLVRFVTTLLNQFFTDLLLVYYI